MTQASRRGRSRSSSSCATGARLRNGLAGRRAITHDAQTPRGVVSRPSTWLARGQGHDAGVDRARAGQGARGTHRRRRVAPVVRPGSPSVTGPGGRPVIVPVLVLEAPPGVVEAETARLRAAGWALVDGFTGPAPRPGRPVVRRGRVSGDRDAADALFAAMGGDGLLLDAGGADRALVDRLVDDLRRLGPVDHRLVDTADAPPDVPPEARAILGLLAEGHSLGEAAAILGLSRRTADRRLDAARRALGVTRTTEAIARATSLGWLRPGGPA